MTIASLVLGIISICLGVFSYMLNPIGFVCGVVGIVFGAIAIKKDYMWTGTAKAGFITSIVGTVLSFAAIVMCVLVNFVLKTPPAFFEYMIFR